VKFGGVGGGDGDGDKIDEKSKGAGTGPEIERIELKRRLNELIWSQDSGSGKVKYLFGQHMV
jgi:hypothetical protein